MYQDELDVDVIDEMINLYLEKNQPKLQDELIKKIHDEIYVQYNTLNIAVGRQRSGKTHTIIKEIIKISHVSPRNHLLIYINKEGGANDPTFESLKELITIPIVYIAEKDAEEYVKDILKWKMLYNYINTVLILWADQTTSYEPISFCTNCDEALLSYLDFLLRIGGHEDEIEKILWYLERKSSIKNT